MTAKDPDEAANLVNAVARVYMQTLRTDNQNHQSARMQDLNKALVAQQREVSNAQQDLADFRKSRNIDAITPRYQVELAVLGELDKDYVKLQAMATAAGLWSEGDPAMAGVVGSAVSDALVSSLNLGGGYLAVDGYANHPEGVAGPSADVTPNVSYDEATLQGHELGLLFVTTNLLSALSQALAPAIAGRRGLLQTMLVPHFVSNLLLLAVPVAADEEHAAAAADLPGTTADV